MNSQIYTFRPFVVISSEDYSRRVQYIYAVYAY
jgi:hypothetical protein